MDRRLVEGIEACRPGSADLRSPGLEDVAREVDRDPALRAWFDSVQQVDAEIAGAMQDVPIPPGLAERILAALADSGCGASAGLSAADSPLDAVLQSPWQPDSQRPVAVPVDAEDPASPWSRRTWAAGALALAGCVLVAAALSFWLPAGNGPPLEEVAEGWQRQLADKWQPPGQSPRGFDVPPAMTATPTGWQWIASRAGGGGVAYRLTDARGANATLYVVRMARADLPGQPPVQPQSTTQGKAVGYWQNSGLVYVLVVDGDERSYRSFVSTSPAPLA